MDLLGFLDQCETISDSQRWDKARQLGLAAKDDASLTAIIAALAQGNYFHQRLALIAADVANDQDLILALLCNPSQMLFRTAVKVASRKLDNARIATSFLDLDAAHRIQLARHLARNERCDAVDLAFATLAYAEKRKFVKYTSAEVAQKAILENLQDRMQVSDWKGLAANHPKLALAAGIEKIASYEQDQQEGARVDLPHLLARQLNAILDGLALSSKSDGLSLLARVAKLTGLNRWPIHVYARHFPKELADLIVSGPATDHVPQLPFTITRHLDPMRIEALVRLGAIAVTPDQRRFGKLEPSLRNAIVTASGERWRQKDGEMAILALAGLPESRRQSEARHAIGIDALAAYPDRYLPYLTYLPWDEAQMVAAPFLSQPEGTLRALALSSLIAVARFQKDRLDDVLDLVTVRGNEQDPVRRAMVTAIADLPPSRWQENHYEKLTGIIDAALSARDISAATMQTLVVFLLKVMPFQTQFCCEQLPKLAEKLGSFGYFWAEDRINDATMAQLDPHLVVLLAAWIAQSRHAAIFSLTQIFGRRLKAAPLILKEIEKLTSDPRGGVAQGAFNILFNLHLPGKNQQLVKTLLQADEGWSTILAVQNYMHRHRQDWLTRFLEPRNFSGRFSTGSSTTIPTFHDGFQRWTAYQQELYARTLVSLIDCKRSIWESFYVEATLAAMPAIDIAPLIAFASLESGNPHQRDKAVEMLGRVDGGRGVPTLLAALNDSRARVAIYALRRAILGMPAHAALETLRRAPIQKVTVAKEVLRIAGDIGGDEAYQFLMTIAGDSKLHTDIRIALLRAFWGFLEKREVWQYFETSINSGTPALARSTIAIPQDGLSESALMHLSDHLASLLGHEDPVVVLETMQMLIHQPLEQISTALVDALRNKIHSPVLKTVELAAEALLVIQAPSAPDAFAATVLEVKAPKQLRAIVTAFRSQATYRRGLIAPAASLIARGFCAQRKMLAQVGELAIFILPGEEIVRTLADMVQDGVCHPGVVDAANYALKQTQTWDRARIELVEEKLAAAPDVSLRRIALAALSALAAIDGWSARRQQRLENYRLDQHPWIHEAASVIDLPALPSAE